MKMLMITYNEAIDDEVMDIVEKASVGSYSKVGGSYGKGKKSGTHLGDEIWPGLNNILFIYCKEDSARKVIDELKMLRRELGHLGVKAFMWNADEVSWEE